MSYNDELLVRGCRRRIDELTSERDALRAALEGTRTRLVAMTKLAASLDDETESLRAALKEVCRCSRCSGSGRAPALPEWVVITCGLCNGTGRDYRGSEVAKRLLEGAK